MSALLLLFILYNKRVRFKLTLDVAARAQSLHGFQNCVNSQTLFRQTFALVLN